MAAIHREERQRKRLNTNTMARELLRLALLETAFIER